MFATIIGIILATIMWLYYNRKQYNAAMCKGNSNVRIYTSDYASSTTDKILVFIVSCIWIVYVGRVML